MRQKTKSLSLIMCVVLVLLSTVAGTLAYFTDADSATNTFTVGKVGITLTEYSKKGNNENIEEGTPNTEPGAEEGTVKITGYEYTLIPGLTYAKKPVVTVNADSEDAYIRMKITVTNHSDLLAIYDETDLTKTDLLDWDTENWIASAPVVDTVKNEGTYYFRYKEVVKKLAEPADTRDPLSPLFTTVQIPKETNNQQLAALKDLQIRVEAHAIQAAGFENADAAWAAFDTQHG